MSDRSKTPVLRTAEHALQILESFTAEVTRLSTSDVARLLQISAPSAYRLLETLAARNFVRREPGSRKYILGFRPFEIACRARQGKGLVEVARPHIEHLAAVTLESAHLAIWDRGESLNVDRIESPHPVVLRTGVGSRLPAHASATGKCLLAFAPVALRQGFLSASRELKTFTPRTITEVAALAMELHAIRDRGYALATGEYHEQVVGIAAPVRDGAGSTVAAIGIGLPLHRAGPDRLDELVEQVVRAAEGLSAELA